MSSLARKMRRNKAKKDFANNTNPEMVFADYWKFREGKPFEPSRKKKTYEIYEPPAPGTGPSPSAEELEQEKQRTESIEAGKAFLKGLDIFNKKVEDIKANDEHGEHN